MTRGSTPNKGSACRSPSKRRISLNSKYLPMVKTIQTWSQAAPHPYTFQSILKTLVQEDVREDINAAERGEPLAQHGLGGPQANFGGTDPNGRGQIGSFGGGGRAKFQCHNCQQFGHVKVYCSQLSKVKFLADGKIGHLKADCRENKNGQGASQIKWEHCQHA